jgi:fluoride exporter
VGGAWPVSGLGAVLAVAIGGSLGALLRHLLSGPRLGALRGVLAANVLGAAALGALVALAPRLPDVLVLLLGTGLCGALTTWSTLAVQVWQEGRRSPAAAARHLALNLGLGLAAGVTAYLLLR